MAKTIHHGVASNENSKGGTDTSRTFASREETPAERSKTERAAQAACDLLGVPLQACKVEFYGDAMARVCVLVGPKAGRWVTVKNF